MCCMYLAPIFNGCTLFRLDTVHVPSYANSISSLMFYDGVECECAFAPFSTQNKCTTKPGIYGHRFGRPFYEVNILCNFLDLIYLTRDLPFTASFH